MGDKFDDDKSWDYVSKLMLLSFSTTSSKDVYNLVINGEYVAGLSYESTVAALINDGASDVKCVYMSEGNTAMAGGGAVVKDAPNLPAAQAMMDLLSSAEFQNARASVSAGRGSTASATCPSAACPMTAPWVLWTWTSTIWSLTRALSWTSGTPCGLTSTNHTSFFRRPCHSLGGAAA